jgi:hypothetical protein
MKLNNFRQTEQSKLSPSDEDSIRRTCQDFLEGWYTGDEERVARALHPELIKRSLMRDIDQGWKLRKASTFEQMVEWTREGGGSKVPAAERVYEITIHHGFRHIATVSALSPEYMDYLHLAKLNSRWLIVNDLWELREGSLAD